MQKIAYQVNTPKIKYLMWLKELTGDSLALLWKCHPSTVTRVIRGQIKDPKWLKKLAAALGVDVAEIQREPDEIKEDPIGEHRDGGRGIAPKTRSPLINGLRAKHRGNLS